MKRVQHKATSTSIVDVRATHRTRLDLSVIGVTELPSKIPSVTGTAVEAMTPRHNVHIRKRINFGHMFYDLLTQDSRKSNLSAKRTARHPNPATPQTRPDFGSGRPPQNSLRAVMRDRYETASKNRDRC